MTQTPAVSRCLAMSMYYACATIVLAGVATQGPANSHYIFFMKAPTSPPLQNFTWLQQHPEGFNGAAFRTMMAALDPPTNNTQMRVGLTFQWELLDCFLAPHACSPSQVAAGITNFLRAAVETGVPVQITLDPIQFYYQSYLWNWWNKTLPGYDPENIANVEWTSWSPDNATLVAWRNWGSQFRMPTPQPNLASPALLNQTAASLKSAVGAIRDWYNSVNQSASSPSSSSSSSAAVGATVDARALLVGIKIGEEVDVGANYYYYPNGNDIFLRNPANASADPTVGLNWTKGLSGGLPALGFNMVRTLGLRSSGGPPTRAEVCSCTVGASVVCACVRACMRVLVRSVVCSVVGR